jgi:predicted lactoylglutathione lyase
MTARAQYQVEYTQGGRAMQSEEALVDNHQRPLANLITLGARNVATLRDFYQRLGWPLLIDDGDFAAFELRGAILALFPQDKLAADGREKAEPRQGGIRFTIGIMVESREDVDHLAQLVQESGGRLSKEPTDAEFFEGRSAYFADPEDNYWEIAWAPLPNQVVAAARRAAGITSL